MWKISNGLQSLALSLLKVEVATLTYNLRARSRAGRTGQSLFFYRSMFHRSRLMHNFDQKRENNRTAGYKNKDHAYSDPLDFWKLLEAQS